MLRKIMLFDPFEMDGEMNLVMHHRSAFNFVIIFESM